MTNPNCPHIAPTLQELQHLKLVFTSAYTGGLKSKNFTEALKTKEELDEKVKTLEKMVDLVETNAEKFGLQKLELKAYPKAQQLIESVINHTIDIESPVGQKQFCEQWVKQNSDLPMPCVPPETIWNTLYPGVAYPADTINKDPDNFWYLTELKKGNIITNLENKIDSTTHKQLSNTLHHLQFAEPEILFIDPWIETNWDNTLTSTSKITTLQSETKINAPLLYALLHPYLHLGVVNISRKHIDTALWDGDPANREPTQEHLSLLKQLCGLKYNHYEIRCIRQDEYTRASLIQSWGQSNLWTHFDGYVLEDDDRSGLIGGDREAGGSSDVRGSWRGLLSDAVAVRFVLACK